MRFIEIGNYKINLDQVLWFDRQEDVVNVVFADGPKALVLRGDDATALWDFIQAKPIGGNQPKKTEDMPTASSGSQHKPWSWG